MISTQDLTFGVTSQSLTIDCEDGPITSVTDVQVFESTADDTGQEETATTGSASVDSVSTTLAAAAAAGDVALTVASGTGVTVGRRYQMANVSGQSELVEIIAKNGTAVTIRNPLINDYPITTSTFKACRASIGLDSTWIADVGNLSNPMDPNPRYRVRWTLVVSGETRIYDRAADLLRYAARHPVTPLDVDGRHPGWLDRLPTDYRKDQGRSLIDEAFREVRDDLWQRGKGDAAWRNQEVLASLVIARSALLALERTIWHGGDVSADAFKITTDRYQQRLKGFVDAPFVDVTITGGAASVVNAPQPIWRR